MIQLLTYKIPDGLVKKISDCFKEEYQIRNCFEFNEYTNEVDCSEIVIIDIDEVPHKDQLAIFAKINSNQRQTFYIFLINDTSPETRLYYMKKGAFDLIYKPFLFEELKIKVTNIKDV